MGPPLAAPPSTSGTKTAGTTLVYRLRTPWYFPPMGLPFRPQPQLWHALAGASPEATPAGNKTLVVRYLMSRVVALTTWRGGVPPAAGGGPAPPPGPIEAPPGNLRQLGRSLVRGALLASYRSVRHDILGGPCRESIAFSVLSPLASTTNPLLFSGMLIGFVSYGIAFCGAPASASHGTVTTGSAPNRTPVDGDAAKDLLEDPGVSLNEACWCLHNLAIRITHELRNIDTRACPRVTFCLIMNLYAILSMLHIFVSDVPHVAEPTPTVSEALCQSTEEAHHDPEPYREAMVATARTPPPAMPAYTSSAFNKLFVPTAGIVREEESQLQWVMSTLWIRVVTCINDLLGSYLWSPQVLGEPSAFLQAMNFACSRDAAVIAAAHLLCNAFGILRYHLLQRQSTNTLFFRVESLLQQKACKDLVAHTAPFHLPDSPAALYDVDAWWSWSNVRPSATLMSASSKPRTAKGAAKGRLAHRDAMAAAPSRPLVAWVSPADRRARPSFASTVSAQNRAARSWGHPPISTEPQPCRGSRGPVPQLHASSTASPSVTATPPVVTSRAAATGVQSLRPIFVGLQNVGNTCFMNSVAQLLFCADGFQESLLNWLVEELRLSTANVVEGGPAPLSPTSLTRYATVMLFVEMHWRVTSGHGGVSVDPQFVVNCLPAPYAGGQQHDASEFSKLLLAQLEKCLTPPTAPGPAARGVDQPAASGPVEQWFGGSTRTDMTCLSCGTVRSQVTAFWDVSVPLRRSESSMTATTATPAAVTTGEGSSTRRISDHARSDRRRRLGTQVQRHGDGHRQAVTQYACVYSDSDDGELPGNGVTTSSSTALPPSPDELRSNRGVDGVGNDLQSLLDLVTKPALNTEVMDEDNRLECEHCGSRTETAMCTRFVGRHRVCAASGGGAGATVQGIPYYLTLQLNRFRHHRESQSYEKIMDGVRIQEIISVPVYVPRSRCRASLALEGQQPHAAADSTPFPDTDDDAEGEDDVHTEYYRLRAFIIHSGSTPNSGHYFTIARPGTAPSEVSGAAPTGAAGSGGSRPSCTPFYYHGWYSLNDSTVCAVTEETMEMILSGSGGIYSAQETPYVLLYERVTDGVPRVQWDARVPLEHVPELLLERCRERVGSNRASGASAWTCPVAHQPKPAAASQHPADSPLWGSTTGHVDHAGYSTEPGSEGGVSDPDL